MHTAGGVYHDLFYSQQNPESTNFNSTQRTKSTSSVFVQMCTNVDKWL